VTRAAPGAAARVPALVVCAALAGGCGLEVGPTAEWQAADGVPPPLALEQGPVPSGQPEPSPGRLRLVTFNVELGGDPDGLAAAIAADPAIATAGVYLLQEEEDHPAEGSSRTRRLAERLGVGWVYVPGRVEGDGTHGLAILTRHPIEDVQVMHLPMIEKGTPRIAIEAELVVGATRLHLVDVHLETRLNITDRILHLRPAVLDQPPVVVVAGDFNTNPYLWEDGVVPLVPTAQIVDTDQAPLLDDYMAGLGFDTPAAGVGPTEEKLGVASRLDAIYTRGLQVSPATVERTVTGSDHWPVWVDVTLP